MEVNPRFSQRYIWWENWSKFLKICWYLFSFWTYAFNSDEFFFKLIWRTSGETWYNENESEYAYLFECFREVAKEEGGCFNGFGEGICEEEQYKEQGV